MFKNRDSTASMSNLFHLNIRKQFCCKDKLRYRRFPCTYIAFCSIPGHHGKHLPLYVGSSHNLHLYILIRFPRKAFFSKFKELSSSLSLSFYQMLQSLINHCGLRQCFGSVGPYLLYCEVNNWTQHFRSGLTTAK